MPKFTSAKDPGGVKIPPPPIQHRGLSFSFRYFVNREPFQIERGSDAYPLALLERLCDVCGMTVLELKTCRNAALRCHMIDWNDTTEPGGFTHLNPLMRQQIEPYQFSISANEHGRVHGFFIDEVFYIVWVDPDHRLYARA